MGLSVTRSVCETTKGTTFRDTEERVDLLADGRVHELPCAAVFFAHARYAPDSVDELRETELGAVVVDRVDEDGVVLFWNGELHLPERLEKETHLARRQLREQGLSLRGRDSLTMQCWISALTK